MRYPIPLLVALVSLRLAPACRRDEPAPPVVPGSGLPLVVQALGAQDLTQAEERPQGYASPDALPWMRDALAGARALRLDEAATHGARVSLALLYGVVGTDRAPHREALAGAVLALGVRADLAEPRAGEPPLLLTAERIAEHPLSEADRAAFRATLDGRLEALVRDALTLLDRKVGVALGADAAVLEALADPDPLVAAFAAQVAGERGLREAGPGLLAQLEAADEGARLKAIGALGLIRHAPAAPALARLAGGHERPAEIAAAVQALADLGTSDARRYLQSIRDSTPFDDTRAWATQALERMGR